MSASAGAAIAASIESDLHRYVGFGNKQAGGTGDNGCGDWLASELEQGGCAGARQAVSVPGFAPDRCEIAADGARAALWPQPIVRLTGADGLSGPLVRVDAAGNAVTPLKGAIALVDLPFGRWSTALAKPIRTPIGAAFAGGARAVADVTNGPTGKIIALNKIGRAHV